MIKRRRKRAVAGFTLLEMIVVLVIAAFAMALLMPDFSRMQEGLQLKSAARGLLSGLRHARGEAIKSGRDATMLVDVEKRIYRLSDSPREFKLPESIDIKLLTAESELTGEGQGAIRFFPDGTSTGGRVTVSRGEKKLAVDVVWLTGRVQILD